jgi:plastocyanin
MTSSAQQGVQDNGFACETLAEQPTTLQRKPILRAAITVGLVAAVAVISFYGGMSMATGCAANQLDAVDTLGKFVAPPITGQRAAKASAPTNAKEPLVNMRGPRLRTDAQMMQQPEEDLGPVGTWTHCSRRNALMKAAAAAAGMAGVLPPAFAAATQTVKMGSDSGQLVFQPDDVTICKGDSVTWVNNKAGPHNAVFQEVPAGVEAESVGMESGALLQDDGAKFTAKFDVAGTYEYICEPHGGGGMKGTVTVKA